MRRFHPWILGAVLLGSALSVGCGGDDGSAADTAASLDEAAEVTAQPAPAQAPQQTPAEASITVADIDRWQRGMEGELAAVREAGNKLKAAKSATDTMSAIMAANETATRAAGARAAGVDESRYRLISSRLSAVVRYMTPLELEMDASKMPAEMVTQMRDSRAQALERESAGLSPAVIEALRPRASALRKQELTLVGERLRAAGMAR